MNIKKNDTVQIITGKDKGKTGKVLSVLPKAGKITVDGINIQKKHKKPRSANDVGGIVDQLGAIEASNAMVVCPACGKPTRVGHKIADDGKKIRVCKKTGCGASLDKAVIKEDKKAAKKPAAKKASETAEAVTEKAASKPAAKTASKPAAKAADKAPAKKTATAKKAADKDAEVKPAKKSTAKAEKPAEAKAEKPVAAKKPAAKKASAPEKE